MSFHIVKIYAYNFVLYEKIYLNFEILESNLVFITGENFDVHGSDSNGCGKTLIGDLITDLLFDKTIRKHSQKSFIGKFDKHSIETIKIIDDDSDRFFVINKYRNHPVNKDRVFFHLHSSGKSKDLTKKTKADTYKLIWKTLGINWRTFKNRNYYGQGDPERFLRVTDARKAEIIVDIQGLDDLDKSKDEVHKLFKEAKNDRETLELEIINHKFILKTIKKNITIAKETNVEAVARKVKSLEDINEEIISIQESLRVSKKYVGRVKILFRKFDKLKEKNKSFIKLKNNIAANESFLVITRNMIKDETELKNELMAKISDAEKEIIELKNKTTTMCGKCGAKLTDQRRDKSIRDTEKEIMSNGVAMNNLLAHIGGTLKKDLRNQRFILKDLIAKVAKLSGVEEAMEKVDSRIKKYMGRSSEVPILLENLLKVKKRRRFLKLELEELSEEKLLTHMKQEYEERKEKCSVSERSFKKAKWKMKKNEIAKAVFDKSIRTMFVSFLNNLNHFSNSFLDILCDGDIDIRFSPISEKLSKKVVDEISVKVSVAGVDSRDFRTYSGGEQGRIEIATQLALFSAADSPFPFLFFDEPFIGIDESGRIRIIDLFKRKADEGNLVMVISHDNIVSGYGETLNIKRKDGRSWIDA